LDRNRNFQFAYMGTVHRIRPSFSHCSTELMTHLSAQGEIIVFPTQHAGQTMNVVGPAVLFILKPKDVGSNSREVLIL
jgi:hypothetical protein